ncbi:HET-domain-containing protein [Mollisia scopiformis]|uniref:HET-domain-containing protein n=1 Tax=Mollisia scopiformis TaxID=149040 RepID=A0A194XQV9_MOLSC|nr:HET-domain-containing protein [Mollisia scopiformis]KUJ22439.1 HET-domain-containing protein [Mollisia scopiformis]
MRLLNTATIVVQEFNDNNLPPYAILSHRWEDEEVAYQDLAGDRGHTMKGYAKLKNFCRQALSDSWQWVWMDTCCIDKSSSAELSEAINSMYNWYRDSRVCYVYLSDVPPEVDMSFHIQEDSPFRKSQWFTRGWTLQELLAPRYLVFYDREWGEIGTKSCLETRKMSWASNRQTTRTEDMACSLMGMVESLLRLQLEIIKNSDDVSIFAWFDENDDSTGMLAPFPSCFRTSGNVRLLYSQRLKRPYTMTNKGLHMPLFLAFKRNLMANFLSAIEELPRYEMT